MVRPQRIEYEGAVYHVTARGNERRALFVDEGDRERFVRVLGESVESFEIRLYLFCLMTNHIHLVLETPRANLGRFMHRLQTAYTVYFNHRHERHGHLLQGRYGACLVERDAYLLRLSRYVHLNPVFTKAVRSRPLRERLTFLRQYRWSSYRSYIGKDRRLAWVDYAPILATVGSRAGGKAETYRRFVEAGIDRIDAAFLEEAQASRLCLGSEGFRARIRALYENLLQKRPRTEDIAFRRTGTRLPIEQILQAVCQGLGIERASLLRRRRDARERAIASRLLCDYGGLTQREVAAVLGLRSGAAVSAQLHKLAEQVKRDPRLHQEMAEIVAKLKNARG
ncbi:MAG: transposase [Phycisphaerae bacterium]|nr:transposase [Phycisphaerae bacterium]